VIIAASGLAAAAMVTMAGSAGAPPVALPAAPAAHAVASPEVLHLRAMPTGTVRFGSRHGRLTVHAAMYGLTPGSAHRVDLAVPGRRSVRFSQLVATGAGRANVTLSSSFTGRVPTGSRLLIRMGTTNSRVARQPIAETARLRYPGGRPHRLIAVEVSPAGVHYGTPRGRAVIAYNAQRRTLTVTVSASGVTPGPHAAHIHLGSCQTQGPVLYMLRDLVASRSGRITRAVRVFTHVTAPPPAHGWYLNIHQGNSKNILSNGQPTIYFRPLICANIAGSGSVTAILRSGDVVTGVRGATGGTVVLTGGAATGSGTQNRPFLYQGPLTSAAAGAAVSVRTPPFGGVLRAGHALVQSGQYSGRPGPRRRQLHLVVVPGRSGQPGHDLPRPGERIWRLVGNDRCARRRPQHGRAPARMPAQPAALHRDGHDRAQHHGQSGGRRL
jgi:hypothetical protein